MSLWGKLMGRGRSSAPGAAGSVQRASEKSPDSAQAWFTKAEALAEHGHHEEALAGYDRALALDPRMAMALRGRALVLRKMDKPTEALEAVELSLQADPGLALAWRAKGAILRDLWRHVEGLACYEKGLAIDPQDALLWSNKGNVLLELGRLAEAQSSYQRALSIDPAFADASRGLRRAKKAELLIKSLRRDPPDGRQMVVTASDAGNLQRWVSARGFELRREVSGSSTLVGDNSYEHFDHYKSSLWMGSCRLGDWGTTGDHDVWFTFEPDAGAEQVGPQYDGWNRLAKLLAVEAIPTFDFCTRLTVCSYSSQHAVPEETYGNLLTGGSTREEVSTAELENMISGDAVVTSILEENGYHLTDHFNNRRRGRRSCSIVHGDQCVGRMVSHHSDLSITLYRNSAEYSRILEVLRR